MCISPPIHLLKFTIKYLERSLDANSFCYTKVTYICNFYNQKQIIELADSVQLSNGVSITFSKGLARSLRIGAKSCILLSLVYQFNLLSLHPCTLNSLIIFSKIVNFIMDLFHNAQTKS